jgi:hypothetical protein
LEYKRDAAGKTRRRLSLQPSGPGSEEPTEILEGTLDAAGKMLTLVAEEPSMDDPTKQAKYRDVIEIKSANHRLMTSSMLKPDGAWHAFGSVEKKRFE